VTAKRKGTAPLPTRQQLIDYIKENPGAVTKREISRAFQIGAENRIWLKAELKALEAEGLVDRGHGRRLAPAGTLPEMCLIDVIEVTLDGELIAQPVDWRHEDAPPRILLTDDGRDLGKIGIGDRLLARLRKTGANRYDGRLIRLVESAPEAIVAIYKRDKGAAHGRLVPTDRRNKDEYVVTDALSAGAKPGEVVLAERVPGRGFGLPHARVKERLGPLGDPRSLSLIAAHQHGIRLTMPAEAIAEAEAAKPVKLGKREDLRQVPLVTIDPEDARDHDDAVFAEPDTDPKNPGGWHLIVAIADVAHYVRPGSALDIEARQRGNSTYFPDRVVPMLPDKLSGDLCSLHENVDRACLAVHIWLDAQGNKLRQRFVRGLMRSFGSLTYGEVQEAIDGRANERCALLMDSVIRPLYGAYAALSKARDKRQPLDLDLPERKVIVGRDGFIQEIRLRERFDSHRLIEDMMILANVAAAEVLEATQQPCMYRIHEVPGREKLDALREFLDSLDINLAKGQVLTPAAFNRVLARARELPQGQMINEVILRSQTQAYYGPENLGHFGLALRSYAHFTSPIRRYADVMVHRALITGCKLGDGGLSAADVEQFPRTAERISVAERRSMSAERDAVDRFTAVYLANRVGDTFMGRISGVTRFGLFIKLDLIGADGLVLAGEIDDDFYVHDEVGHALIGRQGGRCFRLGDRVEVRLTEADVITGGLRLDLIRDLDEVRARAPKHLMRGRGGPRGGRGKPAPKPKKNVRKRR